MRLSVVEVQPKNPPGPQIVADLVTPTPEEPVRATDPFGAADDEPTTQQPVPGASNPVQSRTFVDVMEAISLILSARLLFLLTLAGAFLLAAGAMLQPSPMRLGIVTLYGFFAVGPAALIAWRQGAMR